MVKHYWYLLKQERAIFLLGLVLSIVTAFAGIALLAVSGWFISAAAIAGLSAVAAHAFNFFTPGAIVRGLSITRTAGRYGERLANHEVTFRMISALRRDLFNELGNNQGVSALMNRHDSASQLLKDIQNVEGIHLHSLVPAVTAILSAVGFVLVTAIFQPQLAMVSIPILGVALVLLPLLYSRAVLEPESSLHQQRNKLWSQASSLFSSLRLLTLNNQLEAQGESLRNSSTEANRVELRALKKQQWIALISQLVYLLLIGCSLGFSITAYQNGELQGALIFMQLLLAMGVTEILAAANSAIASLLLGHRALQRLDGLKRNSPAQDERGMRVKVDKGVEVRNLSFAYNAGQPVLSNLSISFGSGFHWLLASSGRGKTTLLKILAGEIEQYTGEIAVNKRQLSYMPQRIQIIRASLRENLDLRSEHDDTAISEALEMAQLSEWVASLPEGLDTWIGAGEWQPSGGEMKRLGIARLILENRQVIMLDEPFAGMDSALQTELLQNLRDQWQGRTVLIISHDLDLIGSSDTKIQL
jgi:ATP-binding cassette subfamily C protein CydC